MQDSVFNYLENRRRELGMSCATLARQTGLSLATVQRILSGKHEMASFASVADIARALGAQITVHPQMDTLAFLSKQARRKAEQLVGTVQGSSGLEGQAVDQETLQDMVSNTAAALMKGSRRSLWGA